MDPGFLHPEAGQASSGRPGFTCYPGAPGGQGWGVCGVLSCSSLGFADRMERTAVSVDEIDLTRQPHSRHRHGGEGPAGSLKTCFSDCYT